MAPPRPSLRGSLVVAVFLTVTVSLLGVAAQRSVFSRAVRSAAPASKGPTRITPGEYRLEYKLDVDSGYDRLERLFCRDDPHDDAERIAMINNVIPGDDENCSKVQTGRLVATGTWLLTCQTGALYCVYCAEFFGPWNERVVNSGIQRVGTQGGEAKATAACRRLADDPVCKRWREDARWRCAAPPNGGVER